MEANDRDEKEEHRAARRPVIVATCVGVAVLAALAAGIAWSSANAPQPDGGEAQGTEATVTAEKDDGATTPSTDTATSEAAADDGTAGDAPAGAAEGHPSDEHASEQGGDSTATGHKTDPSSSTVGGGDPAGGAGSAAGPSQRPQPGHEHSWAPMTATVHHDAQYQTVHHEGTYRGVCICNGCGARFDSDDAWGEHSKSQLLAGNYQCGSYHTQSVVVTPGWDEEVLVRDAWDETVTVGHYCTTCGAIM